LQLAKCAQVQCCYSEETSEAGARDVLNESTDSRDVVYDSDISYNLQNVPRCNAASEETGEAGARDVLNESTDSRDAVYDSDIGQKLSPLGSNSSIQVRALLKKFAQHFELETKVRFSRPYFCLVKIAKV
jgi:hypothetical protein